MRGHHTKSISTWYAFIHLGNTRLAASIFELKKDGYEITSVIEKSKNKFGDEVRYSRYTLVE